MTNYKLIKNIAELVTLEPAYQKDGRNLSPQDLGVIKNASIIYSDDEIIYAGENSNTPSNFNIDHTYDMAGVCITPAVVDSHTHLVFSGDRSNEYSMRLNGESYETIAQSGGGILATMTAVNKSTKKELFNLAAKRIQEIYQYGVSTIEIKSGYGLNYDKELELSNVINELKSHFSPKINIKNTFMAAHAVPQDYNNSSEYIKEVVIPLLKVLTPLKIIDAIDIFHEVNYFTEKDTRDLFDFAAKNNIPLKIHADEFNDNNGAALAVEYSALSADHLLSIGNQNINKIAKSNTVATLLPGTGFFLGKKQANARALLDAGAKVSIASDFNPGSCHFDNLLQIASLSAPTYQMNSCELWSAITLNAAHALGVKNQGAIVPGLCPRFSFFKARSISEVTYFWGKNLAIWPLDNI